MTIQDLIPEADFAAQRGVSLRTVQRERAQRIGPPFIKIGRKVAERIAEAEQKMMRGGSGAPSRPETWGEQFIKHDGLKSFAEETSRPGRIRVDVKSISPMSTGAESGGALDVPARDSTVMLPRQRMTIRNLLNVVQISSNSVEYPDQTTRPGAADTVAEGDAKPQSDMELTLRTVSTQVIAHWVAASRQILEDAPQLRDIIDGELRYGLMLKEESQLLYGDGNSPNLHGLIPQATEYADPLSGAVEDDNEIDTIGLSVLQCALADYPATGIVVHPSDWQRMRMTKDADGRYILGAPGANVEPRLFGLPVVPTKSITAGEFLVGDFMQAATLYDRWVPRVEVSTEHSDFFTRNLVAILAEQRLALAVRRSLALVHGEFAPEPT